MKTQVKNSEETTVSSQVKISEAITVSSLQKILLKLKKRDYVTYCRTRTRCLSVSLTFLRLSVFDAPEYAGCQSNQIEYITWIKLQRFKVDI
jgi:nucleoid-associated protein YejK